MTIITTHPKKTLFISDLHLHESQPHITERFLALLQDCDQTVDGLYILGDLFEAWIGDDDLTPFHLQMIEAMKAATDRGLRIYFLHGNRDFLIGNQFLKLTGCQLLQEEERILLYGTPVLLMHGDTLCRLDHAYLKHRKILRNRWIQSLFLWLPLTYRKKIANNMRKRSQHYLAHHSESIMDVTQEAVHHVMHKHRVLYLIHGHTHRPAFHTLQLDNQPATRVVLGAWHERGNMLIWDADGEKKWVEF